ncbi:pyridoxamine 5'-phosphate oxidase [Pseudidiomarina sp.]|uniref:pyridoxamine 5'-phosphate oxidase n=1 Tax=Pseudidiomarina sp. TaxID=2081707 RepID=UPI00299D8C81|nr:pyridoxamine 5'-phosphate oxidase [Pseudidiomarina sp.]MDX1706784.1 pyridoxamine 5'-phosphate oxidase [Pseudidiomarina sp.]
MKLHDLRRDYELAELTREILNDDPMLQFQDWFTQAKEHAGLPDPTAFTLATVSAGGQPHQRTVLLKQIDPDGFIFYTNYDSEKGQDIKANPQVAMHFAWLVMERQIRIEGCAEKIDKDAVDAYFASRPRASQLGALASAQSSPIAGRDELEERYQQLAEKYRDVAIPTPKNWGGYKIKPSRFEFWQGGRHRLHDRFTYTKTADSWTIQRLQP